MGSTRPLLPLLQRLPGWILRQPREAWLVRRALRRIRATAGRPATPRLAVLVSESVGTRICKIGYGLKSAGWKTVLLHRRAPPADPGKCFDELRRYETPAEALVLATDYRPVAFHVFANWNYNAAALFVRHRPGRIIFDDYDVLVGTLRDNYTRAYQREIRLERFCLEGADGHCCRDLELRCAKRADYRLAGKRVLLHDCCWGNHRPQQVRRVQPEAGFHIVNCGNVPIGTQREWSLHQEELSGVTRRLLAQGLCTPSVHFHIYTTTGAWSGADRRGKTPSANVEGVPMFVTLHDPVRPDELPAALQQYDAGLYDVAVGANPPTYNEWKFRYTSGNRVFDYLDAGLPVVVHGCAFMEFVVKRVGADILLDAPLNAAARAYLRREDTTTIRRRASEGSARFAIARHIPRLIALYESR